MVLILGIDFRIKRGLVKRIYKFISGFKFFLVELKNLQKNQETVNYENNNRNPQNKEVMNYWLLLEHNRNMALFELQRQRTT